MTIGTRVIIRHNVDAPWPGAMGTVDKPELGTLEKWWVKLDCGRTAWFYRHEMLMEDDREKAKSEESKETATPAA